MTERAIRDKNQELNTAGCVWCVCSLHYRVWTNQGGGGGGMRFLPPPTPADYVTMTPRNQAW